MVDSCNIRGGSCKVDSCNVLRGSCKVESCKVGSRGTPLGTSRPGEPPTLVAVHPPTPSTTAFIVNSLKLQFFMVACGRIPKQDTVSTMQKTGLTNQDGISG